MRCLLFLAFLFIAFAQPPITDVMDNNNGAAPLLEDVYNASLAKNATVMVAFGNSTERNIPISASVQVAGLNLVLDNMTHPNDDLSLLLARGEQPGALISKHVESYIDFACDSDWFYGGAQYANRCDFDNDNCAEFVNSSFVSYDTNATFTFKNTTETVRTSSNLIEVPSEILDEMEYSSGSDNLSITIVSAALFTYILNDRGFAGMDCTSTYVNLTENVTIHLNASFQVAGMQKLFFLRAPVLNEQWFRNNRFNLIILSQSPLYYAESYLNDNQTANFTLRTFNTTLNRFNLTQIVSNATVPKGWSESTSLATPTPLEKENNSFSFIYEFNSSYPGLGENVLGLEVMDAFLDNASYETVILSRMLSYNGTKNELGGPVDNITRKSTGFEKGRVSHVEVSLGFLAVIVLLAFVNFWLRK